MPGKGVKKPPFLLPSGAVWETRELRCLKCGRKFKSTGYRYAKSGIWIGDHLCRHCNDSNRGIRDPGIIGRIQTADEHVRER